MQICKLKPNSVSLFLKDINIIKLIHILVTVPLLYFSVSHAQSTKESHLAIGIFAGAHSSVLTYAFVSTRNGKIVAAQIVRKDRFMYAALGHWPSIVNPKRENLFEKNGVDSCFLTMDDLGKINGYYCRPFQELWKVRFYSHPTEYDLMGWSHGQYKPSQKQMEFLKTEYGIHNILTDYIYGDSLFKLLRDVRNSAWISNYESLAKDSPITGP